MQAINDIVYVTLKNSGESVAREIKVSIEHESPIESYAPEGLKESLASAVSLSKGESVELPVDLIRISPSTTIIDPKTGDAVHNAALSIDYLEKVPGDVLDLAFIRGTIVHIAYEDFGRKTYGLRKVLQTTAKRQ